jgi:hypothetical protein
MDCDDLRMIGEDFQVEYLPLEVMKKMIEGGV